VPYSMLLEPGDQVHYDRHYVSTPGSIDLRQVNFTVLSHYDDDEVERDWSNSDTSEWPTTNYLDIVVFRDCNVTPCDWENLGVGKTAPGTADQKRRWTRYCCNRQAVYDGRCPNHTLGRLIINESIFAGQRRSVSVPPQQPSLIRLQGDSNISLTTASGMYVLLWANCKTRTVGTQFW
jgi:hypothetical protein